MRRIALVIVLLLPINSILAGSLKFEKSEYKERRIRLMEKIPDGIAVIWGSRTLPQNNEIKYFCGVEVPEAVLIIDGIRKESIIFYTTTPHYLKGEGENPEIANDPFNATGIEKYYPASQFTTKFRRLVSKTDIIYTPFKAELKETEISAFDEWDRRLTRQNQFVKILRENYPGKLIKDCSEIIWELRRIKSPAEIKLIRQAGKIGVMAMKEILKAGRPGQYEYELSSLYEYSCKKAGCKELAFPTIISSDENHEYPHYSQYDRLLSDGDFVVFDAGPKVGDYCIDISMSFPINGKFSPRQREVYEACLEVYKGCIAFYRPGISGYEVGDKVRKMLEKKGYDLSSDAFSMIRFFKEGGITHYVGLIPHDAGGKDVNPSRPLEEGLVFACDLMVKIFPGENLGVRVESTVLITRDGCEVLNPGLPREIEEIEAFMHNKH